MTFTIRIIIRDISKIKKVKVIACLAVNPLSGGWVLTPCITLSRYVELIPRKT